MDCKGFVRFDYIATETDLYLLELNTIPGMTKNSILPQQARALGLTDQELFTLVLDNLFDS
jgi:D-alanine-D-alanine ligase